jgi:SAM-dependent methyltransferase
MYKVRDIRSRVLFEALERHITGDVVDVGGGRFAETVAARSIAFRSWTVVEPAASLLPGLDMPNVHEVAGDGQRLGLRTGTFDVALSIQVLEHVFEPIRMLEELYRVVRPGGTLIVMVPQTANIHLAPHHYQNFTRYWLEAGAARLGAEVVEQHTLGGAWSSIASRLVLQYPAVFGMRTFRHPGARRGPLFWILLPFGLAASAVMVPVCLLLGLADLEEEPNNHLMVLRKPA